MIFRHKISEVLSIEAECNDIEYAEKGLFNPVMFFLYKVVNGQRETNFIGRFGMAPLPGCCGTIVSYHTFLMTSVRGSEISDGFRKLKTQIALDLGYSAIIATSREDQPASIGNMMKSGYKVGGRFRNSRTGNPISIGIKILQEL